MQLRHPGDSLLPVVGALLLTGQSLLCLAKSTLRPAEELWGSDLLPVGENGEVGETKVDADLGVGLWQRLAGGLYHERGEVPPGRVLDHRYRRRFGRQSTGPANLDLAHLGHIQATIRTDREPVAGEPDRLPVILPRLELRRGD